LLAGAWQSPALQTKPSPQALTQVAVSPDASQIMQLSFSQAGSQVLLVSSGQAMSRMGSINIAPVNNFRIIKPPFFCRHWQVVDKYKL